MMGKVRLLSGSHFQVLLLPGGFVTNSYFLALGHIVDHKVVSTST